MLRTVAVRTILQRAPPKGQWKSSADSAAQKGRVSAKEANLTGYREVKVISTVLCLSASLLPVVLTHLPGSSRT